MVEVVRSCKLATGGIFLSQGFEVRISEDDVRAELNALSAQNGTMFGVEKKVHYLVWAAEKALFWQVADTGFLTEPLRSEWVEYIKQLAQRVVE